MRLLVLAGLLAVTASTAVPGPAHAQEFYAGKTMTIIVSTGAGGSYYQLAQAFSRHMQKYIPGSPTIIVKAMPGAGNVLATNFLYTNAPKDGTTIGTINNSIPLHQVLDGKGVRYDAREFNWLGSTGTYNSVAYVWHTAGVKTLEDTMKREVILGGTGAGSSIVIYPTVMNNLLGTKFRIVLGYQSTMEIDIAMERQEVEARTGSYTALASEHPDWLRDKKVEIVAQIGLKKDPLLPGVPMMTDFAKNERDRKIMELMSSPIALGRPYLAPPNVPAERVALLRKAFISAMGDKGFLEEAKKMDIEIEPVSGDEIAKIVMDTINAPADILAEAKKYMGGAE